jgi:putative ABC transport system permease protein
MNFWNSLSIGIREIFSHKFRSILTMLGIILGVASLLSTFALTDGMAKGSRELMSQMGGVERVGIIPQEIPQEQVLMADTSPGRTAADAEAIAHSARLVSAVTPVYEQPCTLTRGSATYRTQLSGAWEGFVPINKHVIEHGRNICQLDQDEANRVVVIGTKVVEELWPENPKGKPIGETILVNSRPFKVVGIFEHYESDEDKRARLEGRKPTAFSPRRNRYWNPYDRKNGTILAPFNTVFYEFKSANVTGKEDQGPIYKVDSLNFQVADTERMQDAMDEVQKIVINTHRGVQDFTFDTRQDWAESIEKNARNIKLSGGLIASISLIVGGIGITNIMLASITERIREIGVRRAVGAKSQHIFVQILVESSVIGLIGGLVGLLAAYGMIDLLEAISEGANKPVVEPRAVMVSFLFAVIIGVVSGLYPAWKASRIAPMEALRYG